MTVINLLLKFFMKIYHLVYDLFEVEQTPFTGYEGELPNQHFKSSSIVDVDLHSPEIIEQQEIYKSGNDILEQEQEKTSNVEDILFHFKQQDEQYQECFVSLNGCESHEFHELFQRGQEQPSLVHIVDFKQQRLSLLDQPESPHVLDDPISDWMDSVSTGVSNIVVVGMMHTVCGSKYELPLEFLLCTLLSFHVFSSVHEDMPRTPLLDWLFWKFVYT
jgi:hypothetical protein